MLFNSIEYLIFIFIFFITYWFVVNRNLKFQNLLILLSSYIFYGWWDYRFLSLIFLSTIVDYFIGINIPKSSSAFKRKILLFSSLFFNLSLLGFFKYYNFFIDSWIDLFNLLGYEIKSIWTLNIILPVGISFYTFQTLSYTIDIYKNKLKPTKDFILFASFVSFFPQLVAGPIERATNLLPQILKKRQFKFQQAVQGLRLIVWGMFKKVVIADTLAPHVDDIFNNYQDFDGGILFIGAIYFAFQIYCDFSGYSDIAIGTAKLLGIELMSNFKFPYFSRNIAEFWRRWHISLSTWFRDYLYIPLGGSKDGRWKSLRNIYIIFIVSGFWHGANWTFIAWGLIHASFYLPSFLLKTNRKYVSSIIAEKTLIPSAKESFEVIITFFLVTIAWVFFRSPSLIDSFQYIEIIFTNFQIPRLYRSGLFYIIFLVLFEYLIRHNERLSDKYFSGDWIVFSLLIIAVLEKFGDYNQFIYFQF